MDKKELVQKREIFFHKILEMLKREPDETDKLMKQDRFYFAPSKTTMNSEKGELVILIPFQFQDKKVNVWYSIWQYAFDLKIGIFVEDPKLETAFQTDPHREIKYIWGGDAAPRFDSSRATVMYEWEFRVPRLFESYIYQEKYILGVRHMHFRLMRVLYDECVNLKKMSGNEKKDMGLKIIS